VGRAWLGLGRAWYPKTVQSVHSAFPHSTAHVGTILGLSSMGGGDFNM
jgi:hypothetical protein